jgi:hypothetical protein
MFVTPVASIVVGRTQAPHNVFRKTLVFGFGENLSLERRQQLGKVRGQGAG